MDELLTALRAAGEPTRLRILATLASGELAVSELTQVLLQSQPRISRHLKFWPMPVWCADIRKAVGCFTGLRTVATSAK